MARFIQTFWCVVLTVLWLPAVVCAGESGTVAKKPAVTSETHNPAGSQTKLGPRSSGESMKQSGPDDIQTRGLRSKKKKKLVGGAAGHTESQDQADLPAQGESGAGK